MKLFAPSMVKVTSPRTRKRYCLEQTCQPPFKCRGRTSRHCIEEYLNSHYKYDANAMEPAVIGPAMRHLTCRLNTDCQGKNTSYTWSLCIKWWGHSLIGYACANLGAVILKLKIQKILCVAKLHLKKTQARLLLASTIIIVLHHLLLRGKGSRMAQIKLCAH